LESATLTELRDKFPKLKLGEINAILSRCTTAGMINRNSRRYDVNDTDALILMRRDTVKRLTREMSITRDFVGFKIDLSRITASQEFKEILDRVEQIIVTKGNIISVKRSPIAGVKTPKSQSGKPSHSGASTTLIGCEAQILKRSPNSQLVTIDMREHENSTLGIGLISGLRTPIQKPGLFVQDIKETSAASNHCLKPGDQLLSVNGECVVGVTHRKAIELIKLAHDSNIIRLIVYKCLEHQEAMADFKVEEHSDRKLSYQSGNSRNLSTQ